MALCNKWLWTQYDFLDILHHKLRVNKKSTCTCYINHQYFVRLYFFDLNWFDLTASPHAKCECVVLLFIAACVWNYSQEHSLWQDVLMNVHENKILEEEIAIYSRWSYMTACLLQFWIEFIHRHCLIVRSFALSQNILQHCLLFKKKSRYHIYKPTNDCHEMKNCLSYIYIILKVFHLTDE